MITVSIFENLIILDVTVCIRRIIWHLDGHLGLDHIIVHIHVSLKFGSFIPSPPI